MAKHYFSILIQDTELVEEIDNVREQNSDNDDFNICEYVANMLSGIGYEDDPDNFSEEKPYILRGSDFVVCTCGEFTLIRNMQICGDYLLYREAYEDEEEWLEEINE